MTELSGARVLLTGATGGLGAAIASALASSGCDLVLTGRDRDILERLASSTGARTVAADLSERGGLERLLEDAGQVDIVVFNAAVPASGQLCEWDQAQIDRAVEINLAGPIAATRAVLPGLLERRRGHLVYVSSLAGKVGSPGGSLYSATKFGLRGFASGLRCDLHGSGVGCSVISPGFVRDAGMFADTGVSLPAGVKSVSPLQVADAVIRAIRSNRAEIDVAPIGLRLGATLGGLAPGLAARVQARLAGSTSQMISQAQVSRRP
jgi:short-subunit dehydrogenase